MAVGQDPQDHQKKTATLAVVNEGVQSLKTIDVRAGDNDVEMPVEAGWGTGAYMLALVHRPLDTAAKRLPGRALGLAWFGIDEAAHTLGLELLPPEKARPRGQLDIPVNTIGPILSRARKKMRDDSLKAAGVPPSAVSTD